MESSALAGDWLVFSLPLVVPAAGSIPVAAWHFLVFSVS